MAHDDEVDVTVTQQYAVQALCLHSLRGFTAPLPGQHLSDVPAERDRPPVDDVPVLVTAAAWPGGTASPDLRDNDDDRNSVASERSMRWKLTIEPALVLYYMAYQASQPVQLQYLYSRILEDVKARPPDPNRTWTNVTYQCGVAGGADFHQQQEAQATASMYVMINASLTVIPALFSTILLGSYSDHAGRKWGLLPPAIGEFLQTVVCMAVVAFDLPLPLIVAGQCLEGIFGNAGLYLMTCFAYVVDVSPRGKRAMKIVLIDLFAGLAYTIAQIAIGLLIKKMGFLYSFFIIICIQALNLVYLIFILPETIKNDHSRKLFSLKNYTKTLHLYKLDGTMQKRMLVLGVTIIATYMVADQASGAPLTLYFLNTPLCWTSEIIGYYKAVEYIVRYVACIVMVILLLHRLSEGHLLIIGCASGILYNLVLAQASKTWIAFLCTGAGFGMELVTSMARALSSRFVGHHEQGALFSSQGWIALLSGLMGAVSFSATYSATLYLVHGFVYYIAAVMFLGSTVLSIILFRMLSEFRKKTALIHCTVHVNQSDAPPDKLPSDPVLGMLRVNDPYRRPMKPLPRNLSFSSF